MPAVEFISQLVDYFRKHHGKREIACNDQFITLPQCIQCIHVCNGLTKKKKPEFKILFLAWAWLAKPKAIVIVYQLFRPCHAFTEISEKKKRGKVRPTACKAYQCASKKARGNKNIFSVEHDS